MFGRFKALDFFNKIGYSLINTPATPLSLRVNAHFGRVFSFIEHTHRASVERQAKVGGFLLSEGHYGIV